MLSVDFTRSRVNLFISITLLENIPEKDISTIKNIIFLEVLGIEQARV